MHRKSKHCSLINLSKAGELHKRETTRLQVVKWRRPTIQQKLKDILQIGFYESASHKYSSAAKGIIRDQQEIELNFALSHYKDKDQLIVMHNLQKVMP